MAYIGRLREKIKQEVETDWTIKETKRYAKKGWRELPAASVKYIAEKTPIIYWLPKYELKWLLNDFIAGLTLGIMLIPQGLAYAKIATIPIQYGLMSSWLPGFLYAFMGTSKDLSVGPTSILGLLTGEIIQDLSQEGYSPQAIASATAFMIGLYSFIVGSLKLGFLLEFISVPVLTGFVSAAATVIALGQVGSLIGEDNIRSGTTNTIHDIFTELPNANPRAVAMGISGIILLYLLEYSGKQWGRRFKWVWLLSICRAGIALLLFTGISYGVNKSLKTPLFAVSKVTANGIETRVPDFALVQKVSARAFAPFIADALEHIAIGKAFGARNDYVIDESQELFYLGVTNIFNSFFSSMGVGGAMSRTAVNSESEVKTPLSGIVTGSFVLLGIYKFTGALFWIPKATLAAIIIMAVWRLIWSLPLYSYWRSSLLDFIACIATFLFTLFTSAEVGIAIGVLFSVGCMLIRIAFVKVESFVALSSTKLAEDIPSLEAGSGIRIFAFGGPILFPNASRIKFSMIDDVRAYHEGAEKTALATTERVWSVAGEMRIQEMRERANMNTPTPLKIVILDLSLVTNLDTTGILALVDFKKELVKFAGKSVEIRFVGMNDNLRVRFQRTNWAIVDFEKLENLEQLERADVSFSTVNAALGWQKDSKLPLEEGDSWDGFVNEVYKSEP